MNLLPLSPQQLQALNRGATVVRVPMEPQPPKEVVEIYPLTDLSNRTVWVGRNADGQSDNYGHSLFEKESPFKPGDVVAIGEEWRRTAAFARDNRLVVTIEYRDGKGRDITMPDGDFLALWYSIEERGLDWQPAHTMPPEFARQFRVIGDVKAVRCQEIDYDTCDALTGTTSEDAAKFPCPTKMTLEMHGLEYHNSNPWEWQYELKERKGGAG